MRPATIDQKKENIGTKLMDLGLRKDFMNLTPKAREGKAKINEGEYIKPKSFHMVKGTTNKTKRQPTKSKKIFENSSNNGLISKLCEVIQFNTKQSI